MIKKTVTAALFGLLLAGPAAAEGLFTTKSMTPEVAIKAAQAALGACRANGWQVTVAIVDRGGNTQVLLRDRFAGPHTPDTATSKAWTAVSFRTNTTALRQLIADGKAPKEIAKLPNVTTLGGGMTIEAAGSIVGGIGISGAPSPASDDICAKAGIDAITADIAM
ncbi:MAG: heme-binding protein [Rhodospirillales bacterium]|nr:heme-binding protein [Rhodospirillales bacterium]MCW8969649.1 heme-binding protein [Rhodospirillales bacterium]MCW9002400.1 heme-binding protein [Rhodospirillales bacterium]